MARSLTVNHQERPSTNPLLTGFLVVAVVVLFVGSLLASSSESDAAAPEAPPTPISPR